MVGLRGIRDGSELARAGDVELRPGDAYIAGMNDNNHGNLCRTVSVSWRIRAAW